MYSNSECYSFKRLEVVEGLFDSSVDATYIITLESNGRYERIHEQLIKYHPTKVLYILTNKGYKRCEKQLKREIPRYDLTDAFITVFKHAQEQRYNNILVLEDDFIFSEKIFETETLANVNSFVSEKTQTDFIYLLGCLPFYQIPYNIHTNIPFFSGGMHAVIYSHSARERALRDYTTTVIDDWDFYNNARLNRYTYQTPLVYQLFPLTENRKQWAAPNFILFLADFFIRLARLDVNVEPGYSTLYVFSKLLFYISILLVFYILSFCILKRR
jgi:hypothetical protein